MTPLPVPVTVIAKVPFSALELAVRVSTEVPVGVTGLRLNDAVKQALEDQMLRFLDLSQDILSLVRHENAILLESGELNFEAYVMRKVALMGDFVSGQNKKSVSTLGGVYNISKRLQLCVAGLLAFPNQELSNGGVIEINWYGYDFKD